MNKTYSIEEVNEVTSKQMVDYLRRHEEKSLFLLSNFETHGFKMTDAPYSGNFKLLQKETRTAGAFCLSRQGNIIIQTDIADIGEEVFKDVVQACLKEQVKIKGLLGDWSITEPLWKYLKANSQVLHATYESKEVLYSLELAKSAPQMQTQARLLQDVDFQSWKPLRLAYMKELGFKSDLTESEMHEHFIWKTKQKISWGLFQEGNLVSIADLNAKALDLGQLGGVYTLPSYRARGLAKSLVQQVLYDARTLHHIRKLIIFTNEKNGAARKVYESLGAQMIGYYGVFFGT